MAAGSITIQWVARGEGVFCFAVSGKFQLAPGETQKDWRVIMGYMSSVRELVPRVRKLSSYVNTGLQWPLDFTCSVFYCDVPA